MSTTPNSKRRDTRPPKKRKRDAEADRQAKHGQKRIKKQTNEANGVLSGTKQAVVPDTTAEVVKAEASALQLVTGNQEPAIEGPTTTQLAKRDDTQTTGWSVSRPLGGRIADLDPILTPDERYEFVQWDFGCGPVG